MNKYLPLVILALLTLACSNNPLQSSNQTEETESMDTSGNTADEKYNFRKTTWGMSKDEVMQSEEDEPAFESEYKIDYNTEMLGFNSKIAYTFNNDELIRASFLLLEKPKANSGYIELYKNIQKELRKKYGKTVIDTIQHKDPSRTIEPEDFGEAVCNGDLLYATQWDLPRSDVQLLLRGEDSECVITIMYISEEGLRQMLENRKNMQRE